jgi:lipid II isoglutaminyl synthase (glutamine-hydrolysing)
MLKTAVAVSAAKFVSCCIQWFNMGSGTTLPGKLAKKIDSQLLCHLSQQVKKSTLVITGTNGKTTACGLLTQFLREAGQHVAHNQLGANMEPGIIATLLNEANHWGQLKADYAVLEVDEASVSHITKQATVDTIVVNNLFRDQLDRYGELDTTRRFIQEGIAETGIPAGSGQLVLNGDDPLVSAIAMVFPHAKSLYYGIEEVSYANFKSCQHPIPYSLEVTQCPQCANPLAYRSNTFSHLGNYYCTACSYTRPPLTVAAQHVHIGTRLTEVVLRYGHQETLDVTFPLPGLFNVYNLLAAATAAYQLGLPASAITQGVRHYQSVFGRAEKKTLDGKSVMVMLIKNPTGATEVLKLVANDPAARLLIMLNDDYADGRDVSWIWDVQFDLLSVTSTVVISGSRAHDMALRLKYAGVSASHITVIPQLTQALNQALSGCDAAETLYILPTYTALLALKQHWGN